ncbi:MAG: LysM peptidoglycan-binding domain-containing protein [Tissierella sp.]|nr:LysM peptidoglycan-binding domain-containing protein [Tissierella sp.]
MESKTDKMKIKSRPLTKNEKFLIIALGLVLVFWVSFKFVFDPQAAKLEELEKDREIYHGQIVEYNQILKNEESIKEELLLLMGERESILYNYFPSLDQAQILYLLNDLIADDRVNIADMSFIRPSIETKGELDIHKMDVNIPLSGSYDGILDIVRAIENSPRKILVHSLNLGNENNDQLVGNMNLKIYSLEGFAKAEKDVIPIDIADTGDVKTPFTPYSDFTEPISSYEDDMNLDESEFESYEPTERAGLVLYEFDDSNYEFIPSNPRVKGNVVPSTIRKSGKYSMRLEYNILALEEENRAYVNLNNNDILFKYPPNSIGMWIYSYGYSPGTLGLQLKGQAGEEIEVEIAEGISWMGWSYIETNLPQDLKLYPLKLERLFFEIPYKREDYGVLLIDQLEAFYSENSDANENEKVINDFYVVQSGDTVSEISRKTYGTISYKNEIMELNDIKPGDTLSVGRVLVLRRR